MRSRVAGGSMNRVLRHEFVKPLFAGDLWKDPLTRHPCGFITGSDHRCRNDATHITTNRRRNRRCCFTHAVRYVEWQIGRPVTTDMVESVDLRV